MYKTIKRMRSVGHFPVAIFMMICTLGSLRADPPSSSAYQLKRWSTTGGNPNQLSAPLSPGYIMGASSLGGVADEAVLSTTYDHYPGYLVPAGDLIYGCTDADAYNFNPAAGADDGSCYGMLGDVNLSGSVDVVDIVALVGFIFGIQPSAYEIWASDANGDGLLNVLDVVEIVGIIFGS